jgi:hypothetical protein
MVTKVIKHILSSKVTRGINNNEETSEVKQTLEEDTIDLETHWTLATTL